MEKALLISHATAGGLTLLSGILAGFFGRKGGKIHVISGRVFFWSMTWIFISALLIVAFVRFNFFLTIIAVFSFYMTFSGVRVLKLKKDLKPKWYDWFAAITTVLFGLSLFVVGIRLLTLRGFGEAMAYLCLFFGFFTANTARLNIRGFVRKGEPEKMWWWFAHMNLMGGAFIASITAFLVQNGHRFNAPEEMGWLLWLLPAALGSPLISYSAKKYRMKFRVGKYATAPKMSV